MQDLSNRNFGLIVAYLIPGFVMLWGLSFVNDRAAQWLEGATGVGPAVGSVFYVMITSIGLGMVASAVRWAIIDQIHEVTGLRRPDWPDRDLHTRLHAYNWINENYYRYYQFYGNTLVATLFAYALWRSSLPDPTPGFGWLDASLLLLSGVLFAGSRSALSRYYRRGVVLLAQEETELPMTNGGGHHGTEPKKPNEKDGDRKAAQAASKAGSDQPVAEASKKTK